MAQLTVLITGGTGLVGSRLSKRLLAAGHEVIILTRDAATYKGNSPKGLCYASWNIKNGEIDEAAIAKADAIVHLAGAGVVDKPWTDSYKRIILESRVESASLLVKALKTVPNKVKTVISASAIGWYGADGTKSQPFKEDDPAADNFLGNTCRQWEASIQPVLQSGQSLYIFRFGIVLDTQGGALKEFLKPLQFRIAGILGNGKQIVSWIHADDLCAMMEGALEQAFAPGIYNAVAPHPVSNKHLNHALARALYGNSYIALPVPSFVLKLMLGARSIEVLKSTNVSAEKIEAAGFEFQYPHIGQASAALLGRRQYEV